MRAGDLVLVCDVGGGTADFSLIAVAGSEAGLSQQLDLHRIAVGEHILLGGDNMDLALAYALKEQVASEGKDIDHWQFLALVHAARGAKERLLGDPDLDAIPIAVPSRGARLFTRTVTTRPEQRNPLPQPYFSRTFKRSSPSSAGCSPRPRSDRPAPCPPEHMRAAPQAAWVIGTLCRECPDRPAP